MPTINTVPKIFPNKSSTSNASLWNYNMHNSKIIDIENKYLIRIFILLLLL